MIDWFALLTPFLVLPVVLLFVFVGCALSHSASSATPSLTMRLTNRVVGAPLPRMSFNAHIEFTDPMGMVTYGVELAPMTDPTIGIRGGESVETRHRDTSRLGATPPAFEWTITNPRVGTWTVTCQAFRDSINEYPFRGMPQVRNVVSGEPTAHEVYFQLIRDPAGNPIIQPTGSI